MPHLKDAHNRLVIDLPRTDEQRALCVAGATSVVYDHHWVQLGLYVDCETPGRNAVAHTLRGKLPSNQTVWVSLYPYEERGKITDCVTLLCWFAKWLPIPMHEAYCLWWDWVPKGETKPSIPERLAALLKMQQKSPKQLWVY